ncbi:MAG: fatty acid cis/trans isomerase [Acidiferrobacterales bacterium]|nr:fatty acid cis/trans isomerase [Acidiferrobacterales bacterium]
MFEPRLSVRLAPLMVTVLLAGCVTFGISQLENQYGPEIPRDRQITSVEKGQVDYWKEVKPVLDNRCVVCHGCYDAPCQLKLTSPEGVFRGASKQRIYHQTRIKAAPMSRLHEDANQTAEWRKRGFYPVVNERTPSLEANQEASLMYQLLELKERHPLPAEPLIDESEFTLSLGREESCPAGEEFETYQTKHRFWGMPYALPGLPENEQHIIKKWLEQGAGYTSRKPLEGRFQKQIEEWEQLLNGNSLKAQLSSRYIYEHLFLGHLYFSDISDTQFFKLVRSSTPPGKPIDIIATRRPYSDPGVERVYYRITPELETIVAKSHLPYALNSERKAQWESLFYRANFEVARLPGYDTTQSANPFATFKQLPMRSRYKFMLDEAQFTIGNYIRGSVCRGQVALNVIRDHFWVFFVDPDIKQNDAISEAVDIDLDAFELPAASGNIYLPITTWLKYAIKQREAIRGRNRFMREQFGSDNPVTLDLVWDGEGTNPNAALTIYRHLNNASVEKGLLGDAPQTAWLISYPLLERIHYLLVAGYDVYGNYGHQLITRLYMDFLRIDGEMTFLGLLPGENRIAEWRNWYRDNNKQMIHMMTMMTEETLDNQMEPSMIYRTSNPKKELFEMLERRLDSALPKSRLLSDIQDRSLAGLLDRLSNFSGSRTRHLPEVSYIRFRGQAEQPPVDITLLRNNAHLSITSLFRESKTLAPEENTVSVLSGMVGAYPNALFEVRFDDREEFISDVLRLSSDEEYRDLKTKFGIRRTDPNFWRYSDALHFTLRQNNPVEFGMLDYSRLENR